MVRAHVLGVAGMMGSGKSTLARGLASLMGWEYIAESATALRYLPELFHRMDRLAFEAQVGFFCNKAIAVMERLQAGVSIVLDRTLYEDWLVFARYFRDIDKIDQRAYETYVALAEHFTNAIPPPILTIFCDCPLDVARQRISERKREAQKHYPANHLQDINALYAEWISTYNSSPLARVDTVAHDFRNADALTTLVSEIRTLFERANPQQQLSLFAPSVPALSRCEPAILQSLQGAEHLSANSAAFAVRHLPVVPLPRSPFAYVAAPFTQFARPQSSFQKSTTSPPTDLISVSSPHGTIPVGKFRRALLSLESALARKSFNALIPHRDVNMWGKKIVPPGEVFEHCSLAIRKADLVVAVLGSSPGAHYEVGLAQGLAKPVIAIHCAEIPISYIANGMSVDPTRTLVCRCDHIQEIPRVLERPEVDAFLSAILLL
ncbi:MAG TPA: deoxynucleoside kinase [Clostridia bacterium]|nr:deoxynucleoside kinase [Clostridia bacterium]